MESVQEQIDTLKGQVLAAHIIIGFLCKALAGASLETRGIVERAFDDAANTAEHAALAFGKTVSSKHTVEALRLVEEMRSAIIDGLDQRPEA
jgi:hypothetical protein